MGRSMSRTATARLAAVGAVALRRVARGASLRDSEGRKIHEAPSFDARDGSDLVVGRQLAIFERRPFGVLAYVPSRNGIGAMVWELGQERYVGDPQGRAARQGVVERMVVKRINGTDISTWQFQDILDLLNDKILDNSSGKFQSLSRGQMTNSPAELPVTIEFVQLKQADKTPAGPSPPIDLDPEPCPAGLLSYEGHVDDDFLERLLRIQRDHAGQVILSIDDAVRLVDDVAELLRKEETLQRVQLQQVVVVGDLHGQFFDLLRIFDTTGKVSESNPYLFNGDFVDRGAFSLETILLLFALKLRFPRAVFMNRGNHEAADLNLRYGFAAEIRERYGAAGKRLFDAFAESFRWLPLAHVLNDEVFVVHAGLPGPDPRLPFNDAGGKGTGYDAMVDSGRRGGGQNLSLLGYNPDNVSLPPRRHELSLQDIANLPRGGDPATDLRDLERLPEAEAEVQRLIVDLLWADPRGKTGYGPSYRVRKGCYIFGPDVTTAFLRKNQLRLMIRSHEVKVQGYEWTHSDCITVFSAPNYLGHARNKGAVVKLTLNEEGHLTPSFITYEPQMTNAVA